MEIYECNLCGAKSGDKDTMQKHIEQTNHKFYTTHQIGNDQDDQEPVQVKVTLDGRPWHKYECQECDFACNYSFQMWRHLKQTGHSDCKPLKPESDGQAEQPKSMADYSATLSPKELLNYYPEAAEDDEQEDRRRAKKKASRVTEVWWDEMTQTVRECLPPLGVMPRRIHEDHRLVAIAGAIIRAADKTYPIRQEWIDEYNELAERRRKK